MESIINKTVNWIYSFFIRRRLKECGKKVLFPFHSRTLIGLKHVKVGSRTAFSYGICITAWDSHKGISYSPAIEIGEDCHFGDFNQITSCNGIRIGNNLLTGRNVIITDNSHGVFDDDASEAFVSSDGVGAATEDKNREMLFKSEFVSLLNFIGVFNFYDVFCGTTEPHSCKIFEWNIF